MHDQIIAVPKNGKKTQAALAAERLRQTFETEHGIHADVHEGYGLALVSVWVGLVVWCDGERYWWRVGWDARRKRVLYARHPAIEPSQAARRIAFHCAQLREPHALSTPIAGAPPCA
ncbi:hypothetical protein FAF44_15070 [Nonomuraea sp. MG754425]|uniref:hypothetical protein n=1 Tax=Nonomuraea sp. MG754425 TaxID=2570319 RepID=UPI001F259179|nr:hypothetical protein [Nonomuraea sp. MG754425]MCF6469700.1 hypothetical protein [Nonomuraea sp. MG754425]